MVWEKKKNRLIHFLLDIHFTELYSLCMKFDEKYNFDTGNIFIPSLWHLKHLIFCNAALSE